jgi:hypothetical protein
VHARHLIAAECCAFLEKVDPQREQWDPFRSWESELGPTDTIITFNYDRVLETLAEAHNRRAQQLRFPMSQLKTIRPGRVEEDMRDSVGCCPVMKLHGSVDWRLVSKDPAAIEIMDGKPTFAIDCKPEDLAIATPGPSKKDLTVAFADLWRQARKALSEASVIVFVGFRFPPTDSDARRELLGAIRENHAPNLSVHIVLGPAGEHSKRLESLLEFVRPIEPVPAANALSKGNLNRNRQYKVTVHPLYAQDFFSVFTRDALVLGP